MRRSKPIIIVHGGAGDWPSELHKQGLNGVRRAADRGFRILSSGGSALDAVQIAIVSLEDDPVFNAGRGSTLNLRGEIETDAAIMEGKTLRGAGVALLRDIQNPISQDESASFQSGEGLEGRIAQAGEQEGFILV